ncbi:MAG TPA: phenylalanine--tRNA ligase subunit beta [Oligoflexia bacterium]|nr:phenylalanine--tRNA ligase subunit beta [Oligoflexia bacterium]HMR24106.1 phenylalanine--tRNA ligase subunit beta [Oligoflexia bacterium]
MKVLLSWLNEYLIDKVDAKTVEESLLRVGIEVDKVQPLGKGLEHVVVAKVKDFVPHPNADKLRLCDVTDGKENYKIVCGAKNFNKGDHVALAKVGADLPNGLKIKASKIRGEESFGMLCSKEELGLAKDDEDGIIVFSDKVNLGELAAKQLGLDDTLFELELTPNRGDCLSIIGVAREVAAALNGKSKSLDYGTGTDDSSVQIEIVEKQHVDCYTLVEINGIECKTSEQKIINRLETVGQRSINAVVDIGNYCMFETGQPMHGFDRDKLVGKIFVRFAQSGEKLLCLDDIERSLNEQDLIIADEEGPIAIAGVIGGARAKVTLESKNILLEAASFDAGLIRQTAKRLKLSTESSYRFERHVDPKAVWPSALKAAKLIIKTCGGHQASTTWYESEQHKEQDYILKQHTISRVLGTDLPEAGECLSRLGMSVQKYGDDLRVEVPTYRHDITREIDLVEEVARIYGYDNFKGTIPRLNTSTSIQDEFTNNNKIKSVLKCSSYHEVKNYSFFSKEDSKLNLFWHKEAIALKNALNEKTEWMRNSLIPGLLNNLNFNYSQQHKGLKIFEISKTYGKHPSLDNTDSPASEKKCLAMLISGKADEKKWYASEQEDLDFFTLKGDLETVFEQYALGQLMWQETQDIEFLHPGKSALIQFQNKTIGFMGEVHPSVCRRYDVPRCYVLEIETQAIENMLVRRKKFKSFSTYPSITRDFSFVVDNSLAAGEFIDFVVKQKIKNCVDVQLFDLFESKKLGKNKKSIAIKLKFQSNEETLQDKDIDKQCDKLLKTIDKQYNLEVRQ